VSLSWYIDFAKKAFRPSWAKAIRCFMLVT
jgi:hypothetical protein